MIDEKLYLYKDDEDYKDDDDEKYDDEEEDW